MVQASGKQQLPVPVDTAPAFDPTTTGGPAAAETFNAVLEAAGKIEVDNEWAREVVALVAFAVTQVKGKDITGALVTARGINAAWNRAKVLAAIAAAQTEAGDHGAPSETWAQALINVKEIHPFDRPLLLVIVAYDLAATESRRR